MAEKDYYERLCKFYEIMVGTIPDRDSFKRTLKQTVTEEDLEVFFMLPMSGNIHFSKLKKKSKMPEEELHTRLNRLASEGFILVYNSLYERGNPIYMAEQQVRKPEDTPRRTAYAKFFNKGIEGDLEESVKTKTPYYRVLAAETAIKESSELREIDINITLPKPGEVLPVDIVTEMINNEANLIGVAKCFCRLTKRHLEEGCDHPLETCFVFNELAQALISNGFARKIDYDETIQILMDSEEKGLVLNVDNCGSKIRSLCNCCPCCCIVLRSMNRGEGFAGTSSRYVVNFEADKCKSCKICISRCPTDARSHDNDKITVDLRKCLGCGLCVITCPSAANSMVLRGKTEKIPETRAKLYDKIYREAMLWIARKKIFGKKKKPS